VRRASSRISLWALNSNAQQHAFVRSVVTEYITARPTEPAAKALLSLSAGYEWVRDDGDALLVDTNTGEILQVEYGVFG
jgi:hypothetical protein